MTSLQVRPFDTSWTLENAQAYLVALKKKRASLRRSFDTKRSASNPKGWVEANAALRLAGVGHLLWLAKHGKTHSLAAGIVPSEITWPHHWNRLFSGTAEELFKDNAWIHAVWKPFEQAISTLCWDGPQGTDSPEEGWSTMVQIVSEGWFPPDNMPLGFSKFYQKNVLVGFKEWLPQLGVRHSSSDEWLRL